MGAINEILPKATGVGKVDPNSNGNGEIFNSYEGESVNVASVSYSHAEGRATKATGFASHAEGYSTTASGAYSHAEGDSSEATGNYSHAEGSNSRAEGDSSHAEGADSEATGDSSHAEGGATRALTAYEHAEGYYNKSYDSEDASVRVIHSVGIGTTNTTRKNAHEIKFNGGHYVYGLGGYDGTNSADAQSLQEVIDSKQETITAGTGLEFEGNTLNVTLDTTVFKVVSALPDSPAQGDENKIHLVPAESTGVNNVYTEYVWENSAWKELGVYTSEVDLTPYLKTVDAADTYLSKTDAQEIYATNEALNLKQDATDEALDTTDKTVIGAINELVDIAASIKDFTNTKVFTNNFNANKVIRKLFIDTSGYSGNLSLDGLRLKIIAKNVRDLYGIQLANSANETISSPWMDREKSIQSQSSDGIYFYVEYNWENMNDGQLKGAPFILTNEAFNPANDPRGCITNENIADNSIDINKLSDEISEKLNNPTLQDNSLDFYKMKLTPNFLNFNVSNLFNVLDYEGFNKNPDVWKASDGDESGTHPTITIEEQSNILGLKYSRCFSIKDELYNGNYYSKPYFILRLEALKGIKTKSFCFFVNLQYLYGEKTRLFSAFNGTSNQVDLYILWGTDTKKENSKSIAGTTSYLSCDITYLDFNNQKWAFVRGKFWVDDVSVVIDDTPTFLMGFVGGQEHIGEKTITCGWTFVAGDYDLLPFQYYPYNKNFFELFTEQNIPDGSITTNKIEDNAVTSEKLAADINFGSTVMTGKLYGTAGDSITEGAGLTESLDSNDPYAPISGTKKATYGYYIAKKNRMRWANYGVAGSTLGDVTVRGGSKNGFSKSNGRYTRMAENIDYLSIFFGWNDSAYGPQMKREEWLKTTYSATIYWPASVDQIGTVADDGTPYATQEQYDACNAVTGSVGSVQYDNNSDYFKALYVGTYNDADNTTFWGAWNTILPYLINKYPMAKIMLIVPYGCYALLRQCVRDAAAKYGLPVYDFNNGSGQLFYDDPEASPRALGLIDGTRVNTFRQSKLLADGVHPNADGYLYMYPSIDSMLNSL